MAAASADASALGGAAFSSGALRFSGRRPGAAGFAGAASTGFGGRPQRASGVVVSTRVRHASSVARSTTTTFFAKDPRELRETRSSKKQIVSGGRAKADVVVASRRTRATWGAAGLPARAASRASYAVPAQGNNK